MDQSKEKNPTAGLDPTASTRETSVHRSSPTHHTSSNRLVELEFENSRLQRLVIELLLKNQQLRSAQ
jgi:hypothetical protein